MRIPFFDLQRQYQSIKNEIDEAINHVFASSRFIGGTTVINFEKQFAEYAGVPHCISTGNGTDALFLILKALDLPAGSEVIVPAWGCIASAEPVTLAGLNLVFCDVHPHYYTLTPETVQQKITSKTKALIAVHLYGQAAPVNELKKICDQHGLCLIEDCAQAHGTLENGSLAGTFGIAAAYSFYPTKNLGAYGDAGCVLTRDPQLAGRIRRLANHGALEKDVHLIEGTNSRMDALQAAFLSVKLRHLSKWNNQRSAIASLYTNTLREITGLTLPQIRPGTNHVFHIYCLRTPFRDALKKFLEEKGFETSVHYPLGLPFTPAYRHFGLKPADFPVTHALQHEVLSLPVFPELTPEEVTAVCSAISDFFNRHSR
ncbi:MAG: DegT/DnrJ/EryC1/StrS family aminotransferase [Flammeovirgaceae bacterium]|nr:MAG: DegT/DnrJ/EryC1/StrS family aminotransferase [Flammeovirgaceae bacterium]